MLFSLLWLVVRVTDHLASTPIDIRRVKFLDFQISKELFSQCSVDFESTKSKTILNIKLQRTQVVGRCSVASPQLLQWNAIYSIGLLYRLNPQTICKDYNDQQYILTYGGPTNTGTLKCVCVCESVCLNSWWTANPVCSKFLLIASDPRVHDSNQPRRGLLGI